MATYYWVGGTGTWDGSSTTNWSLTSGGLGGFGPPLAADTVNFDSASGTGTCTTAAGSACSVATLNSATLGLTLGANHTMSGAFTLTAGTLTLGSNTLTALQFVSSNANTRTIAFGTGNITLTGNNISVVNAGDNTNLTVTGTPVMNLNYSSSVGTRTITYGTLAGSEARSITINITAGSDIIAITGGNNILGLNFTGFTGSYPSTAFNVYGDVTFVSGMTITGSANILNLAGTTTQKLTSGQTLDFSISKTGAGSLLQLQSNITLGSARLFTLTAGTLDLTGNSGNWNLSTGIFSSNNTNTRSIIFGAGSKIIISDSSGSQLRCNTLTNFSFTGTSRVEFTSITGSSTLRNANTAGGSATSAMSFYFLSGAGTADFAGHATNLDYTGFTGSANAQSRTIYGDFIISSGMTLAVGTNTVTFAGTSGTQQITTNGKTFDFPLAFNGIGGTFAFQDALTQGSTRAFTITNGTVQLKAGATSTVGSFVASSTAVKSLRSTTPGSQATISQASGTVSVSDLTIQDSNAAGGASWNAYIDFENTDAGNNDGWNFSLSPPYASYEPPIIIRSFTQPRRF